MRVFLPLSTECPVVWISDSRSALLLISVSSTVSGAVKSVRFYTAPLEILIYIYYDKLPSIFQKP